MTRIPVAFLALLLVLPASLVHARSDEAAQRRAQSLRQLEQQVWAPFSRGVNSYDDAAYLGTRSRDYVMVDSGPGAFLDHDFYAEDSARAMRGLREAGVRLQLEIRFEQRLADGEYASERGVMRTRRIDADGRERTSHSRFHAISRREDGRWRVLTEYRWSVDPASDAAAFEAATPMAAADAAP